MALSLCSGLAKDSHLTDNCPMAGRAQRRIALRSAVLAGGVAYGLAWAAHPSEALAGEADVVGVSAVQTGAGIWRFDVTVQHADAGWDHYANAWDVVAPDGAVLGTRRLLHPHDLEQPFTRSLSGVAVPPAVTAVDIRAHDSVHEFGGLVVRVVLVGEAG